MLTCELISNVNENWISIDTSVFYMACGGDDFHKKLQFLEKKISFYFISFIFSMFLLLHKP